MLELDESHAPGLDVAPCGVAGHVKRAKPSREDLRSPDGGPKIEGSFEEREGMSHSGGFGVLSMKG
ncbi:MAG: hypothetical protein QXP84_06660 [Candidatus Korarchaeum sp.]